MLHVLLARMSLMDAVRPENKLGTGNKPWPRPLCFPATTPSQVSRTCSSVHSEPTWRLMGMLRMFVSPTATVEKLELAVRRKSGQQRHWIKNCGFADTTRIKNLNGRCSRRKYGAKISPRAIRYVIAAFQGPLNRRAWRVEILRYSQSRREPK